MRLSHLAVGSLIAAPVMAVAQAPLRETASRPAAEQLPVAGIPQWLSIGGQLRARVEAYVNGGFRPDNSDEYVLTRVLLHAGVRPTSKTLLFVEGMDARAPGKNTTPQGPPFRDYIDLRQLYLQLGADKDRVMFRGGRLELGFGDGRLVGALPWANTARTFDGARAMVSGAGYRFDAFGSSVVKVEQDKFDQNIPGNNFYGVYGSLTRVAPKAAFEPFIFWRRQSGVTSEAGVPGTMNFGTYGGRAFGKLVSALDFDVQMALQNGSLGDESIGAWAGHWLLGYTIAKASLTPRLFAEYNQATGDENPTDNKKGTFDQLYPTGHDKYGLTDLVGWQNMRHVRTGLDLTIAKGWIATTRYNRYRLADAHDALYNGGGAVLARSPTGVAGTDVGQELDLIASGKFTPSFGLSTGLGYFVPGDFLKSTTPGKSYTYPYVMLTYDF
jgi:hypothetical protein